MKRPFFTLLAMATGTVLTCDLHAESLAFDVNFSGVAAGEQSGKASTAEGDANPLDGGKKPVFEEDLVAHSGVLGLKAGPGFPAVRYAAAGNMPAGRGAVELSFTGERAFTQGEEWQLFRVGPPEGPTQLSLSCGRTGITVQAIDAQGARVNLAKTVGRDDEDLRVNVVYDESSIRLVINDKTADESAWGGAPAWQGALCVGTDDKGRGKPAGLVSLKISKTASPLPVKEAGLPAGARYAGEPTKWWAEGKPKLAMEALAPDYVAEPWQPVGWDAGAIEMWNRNYRLKGDGLMEQFQSAGQDLLRAPIRLLADSGSGPWTVEFGPAAVVEKHAGRLIARRVAKGPDCEITAVFHAEYDGMVWITIDSDGKGAENLSRLELEIPLTPEVSQYIQYVGAPRIYESQNLARNSNAMALPSGGEALRLGFKTYVWIGNTERGLQWFAESDEGWWPLDRADCIEVTRETSGAATLRLIIRKEAAPAALPLKSLLRFGLMATPVKPMPKGWRNWTFSAQYGSPDLKGRGNNVIYWPDEWRSMVLDPDPHRAIEENAQKTAAKVAKDQTAGRMILPYWSRIHIPISSGDVYNPDGEKMAKLWGTKPDHARGSKLNLRRVSMAGEWSDYLVWCLDQWGRKFGHTDGLYLDETQPIPDSRMESGGGYVTSAGERRETFEFEGSRGYMKRIHHLIQKKNGKPARTVLHNSSTYALPYMSEYSVFLTGEHMNSGYFKLGNPEILPPEEERAKGYYYCYVLPMERLVAEGYWQQWGVPIAWLPQLKNQKDIMNSPVAARDLLSRIQQVDTLIWPLFMDRTEVEKMQAFRTAYGIGDDEVTFMPYWRNSKVTTTSSEVLIGIYEKPESRLVIVSNLNKEPVNARIAFRDRKPVQVRNAETNAVIPEKNGELEVEIPRNDYIALVTTETPSSDAAEKP